jgi:hypothetical protein
MFSRIIALILLFGILFFPVRAGWRYLKKQNAIANASNQAAKEVQEGTTQLTYATPAQENNDTIDPSQIAILTAAQMASEEVLKDLSISEQTLNKNQPSASQESELQTNTSPSEHQNNLPWTIQPKEETISSSQPATSIAPLNETEQNYYINLAAQNAANQIQFSLQSTELQAIAIDRAAFEAYSEIEDQSTKTLVVQPPAINTKQAATNEPKTAEKPKEYIPNYTITEGGSTPVAYTIATIQSPFNELSYELNNVGCSLSGNIVVRWKIKNNSGREIFLTTEMRRQLNARSVRVIDFYNQKMFSVRYDREIPIANCLLSESITPFGRIECSAEVGAIFLDNHSLESNRVLVYLPGSKVGIPVFINI